MFRHIVVGAGSAGAVVATHLARRRPESSVLLVEAGPDYVDPATTPRDLLDAKNLAGLAHDWGYTAAPLAGRNIPYRRGRVVGGTSAINAAGAMWPRPEDFDAWVDQGNELWSYADVEPHLRNLETDLEGVAAHHGRNGPVAITRFGETELIPLQRAFRDACQAAGLPPIEDHNDQAGLGVGPWPMNRVADRRISTLLSHIGPARGLPNLAIRSHCLVDRLLVEGARVHGVRLADGSAERGDAVTLCAGAMGSPAILMRSGLGPAVELEAHGIQPLVDLPGVGARLWDHAAVPIRLVPREGECVIGRDPRFQVVARWTASGSSRVGDLQLVLVSHLDLQPWPALAQDAGVPVVAVLLVALMQPKGHGRLRLQHRDPARPPRIDLNFCGDPEDERRLMAGVRLAWEVLHARPMAGAYRRVVGLDRATIDSHERLRDYVRANVGTFCHAAGTAPIGPQGDASAVLDQHCKLRGLDNLFVADASAFPLLPSVPPNLSVMMLGARAADWIGAARE
jgi:choline dehydrogenase